MIGVPISAVALRYNETLDCTQLVVDEPCTTPDCKCAVVKMYIEDERNSTLAVAKPYTTVASVYAAEIVSTQKEGHSLLVAVADRHMMVIAAFAAQVGFSQGLAHRQLAVKSLCMILDSKCAVGVEYNTRLEYTLHVVGGLGMTGRQASAVVV